MPSAKDLDPEVQFILMKGDPATRKSSSALSYPGPQYWFSFDRKMNGIYVPFKKWGLPLDHFDYDDYDRWTPARQKLELFQATCKYNTIVVDSVTSMADMSLREVTKQKDGGKLIGGIKVSSVEDLNAESTAVAEMIALLKDIQGYHYTKGKKITVILIAHIVVAEYRNLAGASYVSKTVMTAGKKVAAKLPAYCNEVYHFRDESTGPGSVKYTMMTEPSKDDFARTSIGLDARIQFDDKPLYSTFIRPALDKLKG